MRTAFAAALLFFALTLLPSLTHAQTGMGRRAPTPTQNDNKKQEDVAQQQQQPQQDQQQGQQRQDGKTKEK